MSLTVGSLFAGIGGLELGLERAGMIIKWQVEINDYAQEILSTRFPYATRHRDVRSVGKHNLDPVDVICGGFPCQDISDAGLRVGITGERSGLWGEYHRIICELRPRYVLVENVAALLHRGMGRVLGDLASIGYDAEWEVLSACIFGAPYPRRRVFIVAYDPTQVVQKPLFLPQTGGGKGQPRGGAGGIIPSAHWQTDQPDVVGVACGFLERLDRIGGLGNSVVPQVAEYVGWCIVNHARDDK